VSDGTDLESLEILCIVFESKETDGCRGLRVVRSSLGLGASPHAGLQEPLNLPQFLLEHD
jgi:hypothetical protein